MTIERIPEWSLTLPDDREIAGLLARCFDTDFGARSFFQTRQHLRLVFRDGPIYGHMALQFRAMRLGERVVTIAGLADVATDPAQRGKGIASRLLEAAIFDASASPAEYLLLFGTARLYAAAGFLPAQNPMIWTEMRGVVTGPTCRAPAQELMVLPLRTTPWDATAELDVLGSLF